MLLDHLAVRDLADDALAELGAALLRLQLIRLRSGPGEAFSPRVLRELAEVEARLYAAAARVDVLARAGTTPPATGTLARPARLDA